MAAGLTKLSQAARTQSAMCVGPLRGTCPWGKEVGMSGQQFLLDTLRISKEGLLSSSGLPWANFHVWLRQRGRFPIAETISNLVELPYQAAGKPKWAV